jgi:hypothetical protein
MNPKSAKMLAKVFCDKNKNLYLLPITILNAVEN